MNAVRLTRSPPRSPVAKSAQAPEVVLILKEPGELSYRLGFFTTYSPPFLAPPGTICDKTLSEFASANLAIALKSIFKKASPLSEIRCNLSSNLGRVDEEKVIWQAHTLHFVKLEGVFSPCYGG